MCIYLKLAAKLFISGSIKFQLGNFVPTISKPATELKVVRLPDSSDLVRSISKAVLPTGKDLELDTLVLNFAKTVGGHTINARGLSLMWSRAMGEMGHSFPYSEYTSSRMEGYFPAIARAIVPEDMALGAIEFRTEAIKEEAIISARR